jgi:hypothetical protein
MPLEKISINQKLAIDFDNRTFRRGTELNDKENKTSRTTIKFIIIPMIIITVLIFGSYFSKKDYFFDIWNNLIGENLKTKLFGDCYSLIPVYFIIKNMFNNIFSTEYHEAYAEYGACRVLQGNEISLVTFMPLVVLLHTPQILLYILILRFVVGLIKKYKANAEEQSRVSRLLNDMRKLFVDNGCTEFVEFVCFGVIEFSVYCIFFLVGMESCIVFFCTFTVFRLFDR